MTYGATTDHYPATSILLHWLRTCVLTTAPVGLLVIVLVPVARRSVFVRRDEMLKRNAAACDGRVLMRRRVRGAEPVSR